MDDGGKNYTDVKSHSDEIPLRKGENSPDCDKRERYIHKGFHKD